METISTSGTEESKSRGAIGLRVTGSLSRIVMDIWLREFRTKLEELGFKIHLLKK